MRVRKQLVVLVAAGSLALGVPALPAVAHTAGIHDNCTNLNQRWPHGVGRRSAVDKTSGTRVTNFKRSTRLYRIAVSHNADLDRDRDGIACEKR